MNKKKIFVSTLGCPKNLVDTEIFCGNLARNGFRLVDDLSLADVAIVNTCSFIKEAREETYREIQDLCRYKEHHHRGLCLIVTGCLLKNRSVSLLKKKFPYADAFVSPEEYVRFAEILGLVTRQAGKKMKRGARVFSKGKSVFQSFRPEEYRRRMRLTQRHFSYVKVSEGCSNCCSYCVIPAIRGPRKSRSEKDILEEIEWLKDSGAREFNLIAQDLTAWGMDLGRGGSLVGLLKKIVKLKGDFWVRLLYLHPKGITRELLDCIIQEEKICSYIDMPVQHINDRILKLMNRQVSRKDIEGILEYGRSKSHDLFFRTSLIVGFPTETEKEFRELLHFVGESCFERLGAFMFSPEKGTKASSMAPQVKKEEKKRRLDGIMSLQARIANEVSCRRIGKSIKVIVEGPAEGGGFSCWGRSQMEAPEIDPIVYVKNNGDFSAGEFINVTVQDCAGYDILGVKQGTLKRG